MSRTADSNPIASRRDPSPTSIAHKLRCGPHIVWRTAIVALNSRRPCSGRASSNTHVQAFERVLRAAIEDHGPGLSTATPDIDTASVERPFLGTQASANTLSDHRARCHTVEQIEASSKRG